MKKWVWHIIAIGLLTAALREAIPDRGAQGATALKSSWVEFHEGEVFPARVFPSPADGQHRSIADFRGKKLILHIFASW